MKKLSLKKIAKMPISKIFKDLPDRLKSVEAYNKIELELFKILQTDHKHKTVKEYVTCAWCNKKRELKQNRIKALGFVDYAQYVQWRKVMEVIKNKKEIIV